MLSIEITKECPLRCPGCYAYEPVHLPNQVPLRELSDLRGRGLVEGVLALVRRFRPIHISIVGGKPLLRYRELDSLLPKLAEMRIEVQLVTSAVRPTPASSKTSSAIRSSCTARLPGSFFLGRAICTISQAPGQNGGRFEKSGSAFSRRKRATSRKSGLPSGTGQMYCRNSAGCGLFQRYTYRR